MDNQYFYYITNKTISTSKRLDGKIPVISRIKREKVKIAMSLVKKEQGEGPFSTLYELKKSSSILAGITSQKIRQRVLKTSNIIELKEMIFTKEGTSFEKTFIESFAHVTAGKFSKSKLKGVHFYDPENTKIVEVVKFNKESKIYSAYISKLNKEKGIWVRKEELTTFFPDNWSIQELFDSCYYAYQNKVKSEGQVYYARTQQGILVKFIIDEENKVLTLYPVFEDD